MIVDNYFDILNILMPRYLRVACVEDASEVINKFKSVVGENNLFAVSWFPGFYCVPGTLKLASFKPLELGFYPMDISSAVAVIFLGCWKVSNGANIKVLDLCCCPGSKFQMVYDILKSKSCQALQVGVDISEKRMLLCKSLIYKWRQFSIKPEHIGPHQYLFLSDGTMFNSLNPGSLLLDSDIMDQEILCKSQKRKRKNKSSKCREKKQLKLVEKTLKQPNSIIHTMNEFDFVIVDAECSHDGSYRHMRYTVPADSDDSPHAAGSLHGDETDTSTMNFIKPNTAEHFRDLTALYDELEVLQRGLLRNGFGQLSCGGTLIYSTCSLETRQNEDIVSWFLACEPRAELVPVCAEEMRQYCAAAALHSEAPLETTRDLGHAASAEKGAEEMSAAELLLLPADELLAVCANLSDAQLQRLSLRACEEFSRRRSLSLSQSSGLRGTVRMERGAGTSGLFVAKLTKRASVAACDR